MRAEKDRNAVNWATGIIKKIAVHAALVYLAMFAGLLVSAVIILIFPDAGQTSTIIGRALDPPFWLSEVACGAGLGWWMQKRFSFTLPGLGAVVPALLLCLDIAFEGLHLRKYTSLVDIYLSADSGATEGLYKITFVAPLYTAVAYGLASLASGRAYATSHDVKPEHGT